MAANAPRTIEWGKIGTEWKKLMNGDNAAWVDAAVGKGRGSGSRSRLASRDQTHGGQRPQKRIDEIKKRVQNQIENRNGEGIEALDAKIEEHEKQVLEHDEESVEERSAHAEERQDAIPDTTRLGELLDKARDMVNKRMEELKGDEKKLSTARKSYPKIIRQVKKQLDEACNEDGEFDLKALFTMIPKEGQEGLNDGIEAGEEGIKRGKSNVGDDEGRGQGKERGTWRGLKEMKKYISKGGDGHNPEQASRRKRDAKL